jgi:multidrug resistance efflux pump
MGRVNATVRDEHLAQLEQIKESADEEISDAEAVRRIFDRAQRVEQLEQELRDEQATRKQELADRRASHEQELEKLRNEYETRTTSLEQDVERLRNEKRTLINDREERTELVQYVQEERSLAKQKAHAGLVTRARWWLTGMPAEGE